MSYVEQNYKSNPPAGGPNKFQLPKFKIVNVLSLEFEILDLVL